MITWATVEALASCQGFAGISGDVSESDKVFGNQNHLRDRHYESKLAHIMANFPMVGFLPRIFGSRHLTFSGTRLRPRFADAH